MFFPASPQAQSIANLFWVTLAVLTVIMAVVAGAITVILFRFRGREGDPDPAPSFGHVPLEIAWTVIPLLIVIVLFALTIRTMAASVPPMEDPSGPDVVVVGHQWWWEVRYPKSGVITANEVHVPVGKRSLVRLETADVIHDFWVPALSPKQDMTPGRVTWIWLEPQAPGRYLGTCAEYCGNEHAWMRILTIAESPADFASWERGQMAPAPHGATTEPGAGLFRELACINCHRVDLTGPAVNIGPDLTHLPDRSTLGAGVIANSPETLARWLENPQDIKPGINMPVYHLTNAQIHELTDYLWRRNHS